MILEFQMIIKLVLVKHNNISFNIYANIVIETQNSNANSK